MTEPTVYICSTCNRVLNRHLSPEGVGLAHTPQDPADHDPVPVPVPGGWTGGRCDFCNEDAAEWEVPARDFGVGQTADADWTSAGSWAACGTCVSLVERNAWNVLTRRAARHAALRDPRRDYDLLVGRLNAIYRLLRRSITGPPRRI